MKVRMTTAVMAFALHAFAAGPGTAATIGLDPGGVGFTCDVNTTKCTCKGAWEGADCRAMKKNCGVDQGHGCREDAAGKPISCDCKMSTGAPTPTLKLKLKAPPAGSMTN